QNVRSPSWPSATNAMRFTCDRTRRFLAIKGNGIGVKAALPRELCAPPPRPYFTGCVYSNLRRSTCPLSMRAFKRKINWIRVKQEMSTDTRNLLGESAERNSHQMPDTTLPTA